MAFPTHAQPAILRIWQEAYAEQVLFVHSIVIYVNSDIEIYMFYKSMLIIVFIVIS